MEGSHPEQIHLTDLNRHALTNAWISMEPLSAAKPKVLLRGTQKKKLDQKIHWSCFCASGLNLRSVT